jgi:hypothetical protein
MRQAAHTAIGLAFWALLILLWVKLARDGQAGAANIAYSIQYLSVVAGAVLAVTVWWIRHNTRIYRRKGPRTGRPEVVPRCDEDRLGRPVRWQLEDGVEGAREAAHLIVDLDGEAKVYRAAAA